MMNLKKLHSLKIKNYSIKLLLLLILPLLPSLIFFSAAALSQENHPCKRASVHLIGDLDVVMNRGGLWALMEQTEGLQDKSVLGIQVDGKLARLVGKFKAMCEEGEKKPTKQLFSSITNLISSARTTWNPGSTGETIVKSLNVINKKLDTLLLTIK
jgi:hypothetical protein